jgi:hypothetical protein
MRPNYSGVNIALRGLGSFSLFDQSAFPARTDRQLVHGPLNSRVDAVERVMLRARHQRIIPTMIAR